MFNAPDRLAVLCLLFFTIFKLSWGSMKNDHPQIMGRVTNGVDAVPNSAPFIVSFQYQGKHYCGGSIINKNWILTAAHCLGSKKVVKETSLIAGTINIKNIAASIQRRTIDYFVVHDLYIGNTAPYDIGLVYTKSPFTWSAAVKAIALPPKDYIPSHNAVLYGWGSTSTTDTEVFPAILQVATVPILPLKVCEAAMGSQSVYVHDTNICTGPLTGTVGICRADSGGPLIQKVKGETTLIGIASWRRRPCAQLNSPSVYVKVSAVLPWIENHQVVPK